MRFYIECTDERCNAIGKQLYPELSAEHGNLTEYVLEIQPDTCEWWSPRVMLAINLVDVSGERPRVLDLDRVCVYAHREE